MEKQNEKILYHYCSNEVMINILKGKQLWMSDISRSNDYNEMQILIPGIFYEIEEEYKKAPFDFQFENLTGLSAVQKIVRYMNRWIENEWHNGQLTSYVICFSEYGDVLSQWRGYANNGKGCSLGFSVTELQEYCTKQKGLLDIRPVIYVNNNSILKIMNSEAKLILEKFKRLRYDAETLLSKSTPERRNIDSGMYALSTMMFKELMYRSLQYKLDSYIEEKEWRMYFGSITKDENILYADEDNVPLWVRYNRDWDVLHGKVNFIVKEDCLIPYFPVDLKEVADYAIKEIITGPKNRTYIQDIKILLAKENMGKPNVRKSNIAFR